MNKYRWQLFDEADNQIAGIPEERFDAREDAEQWLANSWQDLLDQEVRSVSLVDEHDEELIPRMSLLPE